LKFNEAKPWMEEGKNGKPDVLWRRAPDSHRGTDKRMKLCRSRSPPPWYCRYSRDADMVSVSALEVPQELVVFFCIFYFVLCQAPEWFIVCLEPAQSNAITNPRLFRIWC
jgi:hypothetical protein